MLARRRTADIARQTASWLPRASRSLTAAFVALVVLSGVLPVVQMWGAAKVVGSLTGPVGNGASERGQPLAWLLIVAVAYLGAQVTAPMLASVSRIIGARLERLLRLRIMTAVSTPLRVNHFDRREVADAIALGRELRTATFGPGDAVAALGNLVTGRIVGLLATVVLAWFHWWAPLVLFVTFLPWDAYFRRQHQAVAAGWAGRTPEATRAGYFRDLALSSSAGKEIRIFGLAGFIQDRFLEHMLAGLRPMWREGRTEIRQFLPRVVIVIAGYVVVYGSIGRALARGELSLTAAALYVQLSGQIWRIVPSFNDLSRLAIGASAVPAVAALPGPSSDAVPAAAVTPAAAPRREIRFEDVTFRYPHASGPVLDRLDLRIDVGRSLAIVGDNGAGKTTLVKLLCGLHACDGGRITVDGSDLSGLDLVSWRRHITVVFQDFVRYPLPASLNIAFGGKEPMADHAVEELAAQAGAHTFLAGLPQGFATVLSPEFAGGVNLSGGQWQRVAVARALAGLKTGASVLVLDEPTANLDIRAEAELFDRYLQITRGTTSILISHRFANVRRAARIVVLDGGRIIEDGSHDELLAAGGRYATMFRVQAARFDDLPTAARDDG